MAAAFLKMAAPKEYITKIAPNYLGVMGGGRVKPKFCPISSGSGLEGGSVLSSLGSVGVVSVVVVMGGVVGVIGDPSVPEGWPAEGETQRNIIILLKLSIGSFLTPKVPYSGYISRV